MKIETLKNHIGFGIAGNFAHHLDQAGEAGDFIHVEVEEAHAPKGIFPFYLPGNSSFLGTFPLSSKTIIHPRTDNGNLQLEPEVALVCEVRYEQERVLGIIPQFFTAYNDCSIRKEGAKKISEKKNWGENTKGISEQMIAIDSFNEAGILKDYHIASFVKRDGMLHEYGEDSPASTYSYMYEKLKNWIIEKLNNQKDHGPLEDLNTYLNQCKQPKNLVISIGATSYTEFGESTFLEIGDEVFVYIYDASKYSNEDIFSHANEGAMTTLENCSILHQIIK
jgi:hypothetical protein